MSRLEGISIRVLGMPEMAGLPTKLPFPSKAFQLLALLALSSGRHVGRRQAAFLLWDSETDELALTNLRQLLSRVRKAWPAFQDLVTADDQELRLGEEQHCIDLCAFCDLKTTSPGYISCDSLLEFRGDLLEGVLDVSEPFQQWLLRERSSLRERFFALATAALIEMTRYGRAAKTDLDLIAERMLALEPEREATYRTLIEAYGRAGFFEEAEKRANSMRAMLQREYGSEPSPETEAVVRRVFASVASLPQPDRPGGQAGPPFQPRVALLAPQWIVPNPAGSIIVRALIEDVANELARYRTFATLAAHSGFQAEHDGGALKDNESLRADYTVSGFVKPGGGYGDISLRLVNCSKGNIVWACEYQLQPDLLMRSFRSLVVRISSNIASGVERDYRIELQRTNSATAYLHYLDAQNILKNCDLKSVRRARKAYMAAIHEDARFSAAHAGLAQSLYLEWLLLGGRDPLLLNSAREYAEGSINLDPSGAAGHWRKAMVSLYQRDFDTSEESFQEAEILSPNSADILLDHGDALGFIGDPNLAWDLFIKAIDLNPMPPDHYWWAGASIAFSRNDYAKSIELCGKLGSDESVLRLLAASHALAGNITDAREYGRRLAETYPGESAYNMAKLQPHRFATGLQTFIEGLRIAGIP